MNTTPRAGRTAVYSLYDEREVLLYVGVASSPRQRWKQHAAEKPRWHQVHTREVEWFDSRSEALRVEGESIKRDDPVYNRSGSLVTLGSIHTMEHVGMLRAKDALGVYVDKAAQGEPVVIFRRRQPMAVLIGYNQVEELLKG